MRHQTFVVLFAIFIGVGCYPQHPEPWGYLAEWNPARIEAWGLSQHDDDRISDAFMALLYKVTTPRSPEEAEMAADGAVKIQNKLVHGWPGYTGVGAYTSDTQGLKSLPEPARSNALCTAIKINYQEVAAGWPGSRGTSTGDRVLKLYYRLRPPADRPDLLEAWEREKKQAGMPD